MVFELLWYNNFWSASQILSLANYNAPMPSFANRIKSKPSTVALHWCPSPPRTLFVLVYILLIFRSAGRFPIAVALLWLVCLRFPWIGVWKYDSHLPFLSSTLWNGTFLGAKPWGTCNILKLPGDSDIHPHVGPTASQGSLWAELLACHDMAGTISLVTWGCH